MIQYSKDWNVFKYLPNNHCIQFKLSIIDIYKELDFGGAILNQEMDSNTNTDSNGIILPQINYNRGGIVTPRRYINPDHPSIFRKKPDS